MKGIFLKEIGVQMRMHACTAQFYRVIPKTAAVQEVEQTVQ